MGRSGLDFEVCRDHVEHFISLGRPIRRRKGRRGRGIGFPLVTGSLQVIVFAFDATDLVYKCILNH